LYTLAYADKPQLEPSTPQFVLRHKILARSVGVSVSAWGRARAALDTSCSDVSLILPRSAAHAKRTAIIATARDWLESAQTHLTSPDLGPEFDVAAPLTDLRANIAVLRERDAPFEVVLAPGQSDLIPVLQ
jgi:hypothetical protein